MLFLVVVGLLLLSLLLLFSLLLLLSMVRATRKKPKDGSASKAKRMMHSRELLVRQNMRTNNRLTDGGIKLRTL